MPHYVGLDCSKLSVAICVVDDEGSIVSEGVSENAPKAVARFLRGARRRYARVGIEASSPAWLCDGLAKERFNVVRIEALHAHSILRASRNKTDRNDARGIAEMMRLGAYREVHGKSRESRRIRSLLFARATLQEKLLGLQQARSSLLEEYGVRLPKGLESSENVGSFFRSEPMLARLTADFFRADGELRAVVADLNAILTTEARDDPICRRLMTAPGVGPIVALTYKAAVDDPHRFARSRDVAAHFGLTPATHQSGQSERRGRISKRGDPSVRRALYLSSRCVLRSSTKPCALQAWGLAIKQRRGWKRASIAVARRLAVILHTMWTKDEDFHWSSAG